MPQEKKLNKQQQAAITHNSGPLLIIAGAGTGKTTVITERVGWLIGQKLAEPNEILCLTFTEKAAAQMEERIDQLLPLGYTQMWISTFHSFCDRILRDEALNIGLDPGYSLLTATDSASFFQSHLFDFDLNYYRPLGNPRKFISALLSHLSRLKDEDISPAQYLEFALSQTDPAEQARYLELAKLYAKFDQLKIAASVMDFSDLISVTLQLFRTRPQLLKLYQDKFKYILVDEFQDTNYAQNQILKLLAASSSNLSVVADDDQCLPSGTLISTPVGNTPIEKIKVGTQVITAVGKGYLSASEVLHVNKSTKTAKVITLTTESGQRISATDNHKFFCLSPGRKYGENKYFYVYLMERRNLGWRIGVTNDLAQRLKLERSADRIIAIKQCSSLQEANFYETVFSLKYGIPTYIFKPRKGTILTGVWLARLFSAIDSKTAAQKLAQDLGIDLNSHHFALGGVIRGNTKRIKILLQMCYRCNCTLWARNRLLTNPSVLHEVKLETSSEDILRMLKANNINFYPGKKGSIVRKSFADLGEAGKFAHQLQNITNGILEFKFDVGKRNSISRAALVMPVGNIFPGMRIPTMVNKEIIYDQVITRQEQISTQSYYDLEVGKTHNYVANNVVVHNSIYRWRGAAISNVLDFRRTYPDAEIVVLTHNYRSTKTILDASYTLIQHNNPDRLEIKEGIDKHLTPNTKAVGDSIEFLHLSTIDDEAEAVAKHILKLVPQYSYSDIAILVRANAHSEPFIKALSRHDIPHQFLGPSKLFLQPEIKDLIAYLKVLVNYSDNASFYRVLAMDYFALPGRDLASLSVFSSRSNLSLFETCEIITGQHPRPSALQLPYLSSDTTDTLLQLVKIIHDHLNLVPKTTAGELLYDFLHRTGLLQAILDYRPPLTPTIAQNITSLFGKLKSFDSKTSDATVAGAVDWLEISSQLGDSPLASEIDWSGQNAVNLLTIHSAKGLEFPVVFLVNLVSQRFPSTGRQEPIPIPDALIKETLPEGDYHLQEERRLFYVGMTRAKAKLFITAADFYGDAKRPKKISPFVAESLGPDIAGVVTKSTDQLSLLDWQPVSHSPPSTTNHELSTPITYLSYSQIETFLTCPLHYKAKYILKIPTPPSAASSFGNTIHRTLKDFYSAVGRDSSPRTSSGYQDLIFDIYKQNWTSEGYQDKRHEQQYLDKGKKHLSDFLVYDFDPHHLPVKLEEPFTVPLPGLKIGGKIDRVDLLPDGGIEIIDYKTSAKTMDQKEADTNLQLSFYALAATSIPTPPFHRDPKDIKLTLLFLEEHKKVSTIRTTDQLAEAKAQIFAYADAIAHSDFKCSGSPLCRSCDYRILCDLTD